MTLKRLRKTGAIKQILIVFFVLLSVAFLVALYLFQGKMRSQVSLAIKSQLTPELQSSILKAVDSTYNYTNNGSTYHLTFLEFGTTGCVACKKMEKVMQEVKLQFPEIVNVVFYNVAVNENLNMMKFFGVSAIPTQILLDKTGKEYFRHTGYFSFSEISNEFEKVPDDK